MAHDCQQWQEMECFLVKSANNITRKEKTTMIYRDKLGRFCSKKRAAVKKTAKKASKKSAKKSSKKSAR